MKRRVSGKTLAMVAAFGLALLLTGCPTANDPPRGDIAWVASARGAPETSAIDFVFGSPVNDLTTDNIEVVQETGMIATGHLTGSGVLWSLDVTAVARAGNVSVSIVSPGIAIESWTVAVRGGGAAMPGDIAWLANASGSPETSAIDFVFTDPVTGLSASNIRITEGTGAVTTGVLTGSGTSWSLTVTSVARPGNVTVRIDAPGIADGPQTVAVLGGDETAPVPSVTEVRLSPADIDVVRGRTQDFTATVLGTNKPPQEVTWSIVETDRHEQTTMDNGLLSVAATETLSTLTVRATSVFDPYVSGTASVAIRAPSLAEELEWLRTYAQSGGNYVIFIYEDESLTPAQAALPADRSDLTISLISSGSHVGDLGLARDGGNADNGAMRTVRLAHNGVLFTIGSGITLVLDCKVTLMGRGSTALPPSMMPNTNHLVRIDDGGTLIMNEGSIITGNTNTSSGDNAGSGVRVNTGGTFVMNGGEISGNVATVTGWFDISDGSGVHIASGGTFSMHGGTISGNFTESWGGGVHIAGDGMFTMYGGEISGNRTDSNGGGVSINSNGIFNMYGGEISGNRVGGSGGGIAIASEGVFNLRGGAIFDNNASHNGGGVAVGRVLGRDGIFNMYGGTISSNNSGGAGGVFNNGIFNMHDGTISDNTAFSGSVSGHGGGVRNAGTFNMYGGAILGNRVNGHGGGVYNNSGTFNMRGGAISGSRAALGGGVSNGNGTFRISDGIIHGNEETLAAELRNTGTLGHSAFSNNFGVAEHGTFGTAGDFEPLGLVGITNNTIWVVNGNLQP